MRRARLYRISGCFRTAGGCDAKGCGSTIALAPQPVCADVAGLRLGGLGDGCMGGREPDASLVAGHGSPDGHAGGRRRAQRAATRRDDPSGRQSRLDLARFRLRGDVPLGPRAGTGAADACRHHVGALPAQAALEARLQRGAVLAEPRRRLAGPPGRGSISPPPPTGRDAVRLGPVVDRRLLARLPPRQPRARRRHGLVGRPDVVGVVQRGVLVLHGLGRGRPGPVSPHRDRRRGRPGLVGPAAPAPCPAAGSPEGGPDVEGEGAPGAARPAHRTAQPPAPGRPHRPGPCPRHTANGARGRALRRRGPLQGRQRQPRARGRRPAADRGGPPAGQRRPTGRHARPVRWRRVRHRLREHARRRSRGPRRGVPRTPSVVPFHYESEQVSVSVSIGIAMAAEDTDLGRPPPRRRCRPLPRQVRRAQPGRRVRRGDARAGDSSPAPRSSDSARHWTTTSSASPTSRSSTSRTEASSAWRHWSDGITRSGGAEPRRLHLDRGGDRPDRRAR